jgi:hypothetical protein
MVHDKKRGYIDVKGGWKIQHIKENKKMKSFAIS